MGEPKMKLHQIKYEDLKGQLSITQHYMVKEKINIQGNLINLLFDSVPDLMFCKDINGVYLSCNLSFAKFVGLPREEIIGKTDYSLFDKETADLFREADKRVLVEGNHINNEEWVIYPDGRKILLETIKTPYINSDNQIFGIIGISRKIAKEKEVIFTEKEQIKATLLSISDGVISTDNQGNILIMNKTAERLTGWTRNEAYGKPFEEVFKLSNEFTPVSYKNRVIKGLDMRNITIGNSHAILTSRRGEEIPIEASKSLIEDNNGQITGEVLVFRDFTKKKEEQNQIEFLSYHDYLTGLYNRRYLENSIKRLDTDRNLPFTIMVLDVNGLKLTNDAFGHKAGDLLLQKVSNTLKKICRADDIIGRTGGDEFIILLPNTNEAQAEDIKKRIDTETAKIKLDFIIVSLAIGHSVKKSKCQDIMTVRKEADYQMYKNKLRYGNSMRKQTIESLLRNIKNKYNREKIHTELVSKYCVSIARAMKLSNREIEEVKLAGSLHDIGKIMIPADLLNKPSGLTPSELEVFKKHTETGYQILKGVDEYSSIASTVLYHHERWDGKGYPKGLKGEAIPLLARIITVADAYEAMTAQKSYQNKKSKKEAIDELEKCTGTQFDPDIVKIFVKILLQTTD